MKIRLLKHKKGLTLIELMVTIIIIGVVISFGIPYYSNTLKTARQKTAKLCLEIIKDAQAIYFDDNGVYFPPSLWGTVDLTNPTQGINANLHLAITGDFLKYSCTGAGSTYHCWADYPNTGIVQWHCDVTESTTPGCS